MSVKRVSGKEAINGFVYGHVLPVVLSVDTPKLLNVYDRFSAYLRESGYPALVADENAEKWFPQIVGQIETELASWGKRGLPKPASMTADARTLVTWQHQDYEDLTGERSLKADYFYTLDRIRNLGPREFLIPNVIFLAQLGADRIFITDSKGDEGVDLIGTIRRGPLSSTGVFVQAKSKREGENAVSRDAVLLEYAKFVSLPHTEMFRQYSRALGIDTSIDGSTLIYAITANTRFNASARSVAARLGILLRSDVQLALYVHDRYPDVRHVEEVFVRLGEHLERDLELNVARFVEELVAD